MELRRRRITEAHRAGLRNRIRDEWHVPEAKADALLEAWVAEARCRDIAPDDPAYWREGAVWIRGKVGDR
jgi:hypothetical protein